MKKILLLSLFTLGFWVTSCQQKPAEKSAGEQPQQPAQEQTAQQPTQEQKLTEQPKSEGEAVQPNVVAGGEDLAKAKGCFSCHEISTKKIGPAFKDVAKEYAGKANAIDLLAKSIKNGGVGEWGNVPMPPQNVSEEEAKNLAKWVLSLK